MRSARRRADTVFVWFSTTDSHQNILFFFHAVRARHKYRWRENIFISVSLRTYCNSDKLLAAVEQEQTNEASKSKTLYREFLKREQLS